MAIGKAAFKFYTRQMAANFIREIVSDYPNAEIAGTTVFVMVAGSADTSECQRVAELSGGTLEAVYG